MTCIYLIKYITNFDKVCKLISDQISCEKDCNFRLLIDCRNMDWRKKNNSILVIFCGSTAQCRNGGYSTKQNTVGAHCVCASRESGEYELVGCYVVFTEHLFDSATKLLSCGGILSNSKIVPSE